MHFTALGVEFALGDQLISRRAWNQVEIAAEQQSHVVALGLPFLLEDGESAQREEHLDELLVASIWIEEYVDVGDNYERRGEGARS